MTKQEKTILNIAKFLQSQSLRLLENPNEVDSDNLDAETNLCEELYEQTESLHQQQSAKLSKE
ncbi:Rop family plasmid primer RNA-binding protein [Providencia hangzhouensis]|uniref:Rop family plasmid primer RNA-binding protein n=1 Tax=Providencia hangzhouensis TaxID=3031799 RepID=UPI003F19756D